MALFTSISLWCWGDVIATGLVLVGVLSEWPWAIRKLVPDNPNDLMPIGYRREKLKKKLGIFLIVGVAGELACLPFSILESATLNQEAAEARQLASSANERASTNEVHFAELTHLNLLLSAQLLSVSNSAAMNSPSNFPISSVSGRSLFFLNIKDAPEVAGLRNKRAILELISDNAFFIAGFPSSGIAMNGQIIGLGTNQFGEVEVVADFNASNLSTAGSGSAVTFNNLRLVRLNLFPDGPWSQDRRFEIIRGTVDLELNSEFGFRAEFGFPPQTNGPVGVFGVRDTLFSGKIPIPINR